MFMPSITCPECGAVYQDQDNLTCESVFNQFLALEFSDAAYGAVHFLTVACYMIQHGRYAGAALVWIEQRLRDYLENSLSTEQIRRLAAKEAGLHKRNWKVTRSKADPVQAKIHWSMTIMDVAMHYQDAQGYRNLIEQWARTTLNEMQSLLPDSIT